MRALGMIGGMSWESSAVYYREINLGIQKKLGGFYSGKIILYSMDFAEIERLQHSGDWKRLGIMLANAAYSLQKAGAEGVILCTNTMHKVANKILENIKVPFLHIADATAQKLLNDNIKKVALLGTAFTMEEDFYRKRLEEKFGLEVVIPRQKQRKEIHRIIYEELCLGAIKDSSRDHYVKTIENLAEQGAEAVILGCTEIGLLVSQEDSPLPIYDTSMIHVDAAVRWMVNQQN
ncbi:MAG: amino acid racemase [Sulfurovum sp.]|nr:amino acid racemase [Sulfurovum sp.]